MISSLYHFDLFVSHLQRTVPTTPCDEEATEQPSVIDISESFDAGSPTATSSQAVEEFNAFAARMAALVSKMRSCGNNQAFNEFVAAREEEKRLHTVPLSPTHVASVFYNLLLAHKASDLGESDTSRRIALVGELLILVASKCSWKEESWSELVELFRGKKELVFGFCLVSAASIVLQKQEHASSTVASVSKDVKAYLAERARLCTDLVEIDNEDARVEWDACVGRRESRNAALLYEVVDELLSSKVKRWFHAIRKWLGDGAGDEHFPLDLKLPSDWGAAKDAEVSTQSSFSHHCSSNNQCIQIRFSRFTLDLLFIVTVRWSNFDRRDPKIDVFLQSTEATPRRLLALTLKICILQKKWV